MSLRSLTFQSQVRDRGDRRRDPQEQEHHRRGRRLAQVLTENAAESYRPVPPNPKRCQVQANHPNQLDQPRSGRAMMRGEEMEIRDRVAAAAQAWARLLSCRLPLRHRKGSGRQSALQAQSQAGWAGPAREAVRAAMAQGRAERRHQPRPWWPRQRPDLVSPAIAKPPAPAGVAPAWRRLWSDSGEAVTGPWPRRLPAGEPVWEPDQDRSSPACAGAVAAILNGWRAACPETAAGRPERATPRARSSTTDHGADLW